VITSTAAGLVLVLSFHTSRPSLQIKSATSGTVGGTSRGTSGHPTSSTSSTTEATGTDTTHTATGSDIQLEVKASGSKITNISIVQDGSNDGLSYQINSEAVPILQSEALSAQSAQIDGVSGATYTSAAYVQSLQSALDKIGIQ